MVDANNTRATSKKIKYSSLAKNRSNESSITESLIPKGSAAIETEIQAGSGSTDQRAHSGSGGLANPIGTHEKRLESEGTIRAHSGSLASPIGTQERRLEGTVNNTLYSTLVDTSESRRDRAPVAFLNPMAKAKISINVASDGIEEEEEDNSPAIAVSSVMSDREQMWKRVVTAQNSGDLDLAEMLFKAIGQIGKESSPAVRPAAPIFAIPSNTASGEVTYLGTSTVEQAVPNAKAKTAPQDPEKFFMTEGDLVYAIGTVTNHNSVGFAPLLDENIGKLRSPLPLTIFNRKWQQRAMAYHLDRRQRSDESSADKDKSGGYKGFSFVQEWTQTYAQWTRNHRAFVKTLCDVYKIIKFSKLLATHKDNCDDITEEFGFMVAFRYNMEVRNNTFSHRITEDDVKNVIPDILQRKESVVEQCYNICRNLGELDWEENLYAPGLPYSNHDPLTGYLRPSRSNNGYQQPHNNNMMIHNPMAQGSNWPNHGQGNHLNNNQNSHPKYNNFNNSYNGMGSGNSNQNFHNGNKRPRGGYKGHSYSDNFTGKSDGGQSSGRKGNQNK
ncbi:hypothetical protein PGT21_034726 [Puccinia graminis f. sp. tritici]|uniref:Uncharacterized protein n=2 Tax=Puccinia graminis f. sp. tritici TaxID=56615 RepID=E3L816_PUCGT|nr:uncharacterized protein PGTG_18206 [Puccinia graminis f. sp. tritici CRL 75-36-700-3]EFP92691.1 hypothetical protein PGTG_18206 [Puccinia graminis f. sp. tritici CRL 75-36-700-3]KAA1119816.1 hypothetical protein PGT21_034726 [Puccinia graminis f. sp. tritici]